MFGDVLFFSSNNYKKKKKTHTLHESLGRKFDG